MSESRFGPRHNRRSLSVDLHLRMPPRHPLTYRSERLGQLADDLINARAREPSLPPRAPATLRRGVSAPLDAICEAPRQADPTRIGRTRRQAVRHRRRSTDSFRHCGSRAWWRSCSRLNRMALGVSVQQAALFGRSRSRIANGPALSERPIFVPSGGGAGTSDQPQGARSVGGPRCWPRRCRCGVALVRRLHHGERPLSMIARGYATRRRERSRAGIHL